jgi:predicted Fe-Mo cluster-binding NifX family protein
MRIVLPLAADGGFSPHYGAAAAFAVYEVDATARRVLRQSVIQPPAGSEPCGWMPLLRAAGANLLLAGGIGAGARHRMAEFGIEVVAGVPAAEPGELVAAWLEHRLTRGDNACDDGRTGHHHHDHAHAEGDRHGHCHRAH